MIKKKICVVINNRANYARIKSVLTAIKNNNKLELQIVLGSSAILNRYGAVSNIIKKDGFKINQIVYTLVEGENLLTMSKSTGLSIIEFSTAFDLLKPDIVLVVADRYETLAAGIAASYMNIVLAHTQGGEVTGSIDESVRHATTKLAHIHFPASLNAKKNIIKMGENPKKVYLVGCPSLDLIKKKQLNINEKFKKKYSKYGVGELKIDFNKPYIVILQHPVTTEYKHIKKNIEQTIKAALKIKQQIVWLWPNVDAGSDIVSKSIRRAREELKPKNIRWQKNYNPEDYLKLIYNSSCLVGNSSSAIREGAFLGIPAVNIGNRQHNREHGKNIIHVDYNSKNILKAINKQIKKKKYSRNKIFGDGKAGERIAKILSNIKLDIIKSLNY
jgi:UDP-hydrolysing UDP-N-acetyl-D-glucosamine 2-epimerase